MKTPRLERPGTPILVREGSGPITEPARLPAPDWEPAGLTDEQIQAFAATLGNDGNGRMLHDLCFRALGSQPEGLEWLQWLAARTRIKQEIERAGRVLDGAPIRAPGSRTARLAPDGVATLAPAGLATRPMPAPTPTVPMPAPTRPRLAYADLMGGAVIGPPRAWGVILDPVPGRPGMFFDPKGRK